MDDQKTIRYREPGFSQSSTAGILLIIAYFIIILMPLGLAWTHRLSPALRYFAAATGLFGFAILTMQMVLASRLHFIDRPFGMDKVLRFHRAMAITSGVLILLHPVLLVFSGSGWGLFTFTKIHLALGLYAAILLILVIAFTFIYSRVGISYQFWRGSHKLAIAIIILGYIHSRMVGTRAELSQVYPFWVALFSLAVFLFLWRNLLAPFIVYRKFRIETVEPVTHDTWNITLVPESNKPFAYQPGQFLFWKFLRDDASHEEHPFTVSSSPTCSDAITATIKKSGDYTNTIGKIKPGTTALVEGPFGRFSIVNHDAPSAIFIAGGVGITPIASMLRYLRDTNDQRPAVLLYANKTEKDIIFREEMESLPSNVKLVHVIERPESDWQGPSGFINAKIIREHAGDLLNNAHVYLCGPIPMMDAVGKQLKTLGIPKRRIHTERFAW